ncbi:MAG: polymer-forming cytoskeletal protein [Treponema sp.]|jgi:cytoskeletal protein CcmA (bactofilin family)|nr:polymer-forming cytoskeletal protein [Treponema sp.]
MIRTETKKKENPAEVVLGEGTVFNGLLRFRETLRIRGKFRGTIEATGALIVDKDAVVEADRISVTSLTVSGMVVGEIRAIDKVDMLSGAEVRGDVTAARLRIADGVLFEGQCNMARADKEVEIFSRPAGEIKAELQRLHEPGRE